MLKESLVLSVFFFIFSLYFLIPIYEKEDETFRNVLIEGNKYWHDGVSPLMLAYFRNYLDKRSFSLPNTTIVDDYNKMNVSQYVDVICEEGLCYPIFYNLGLRIFFEFSFFLNKILTLQPLKYLLAVNIVVYSFSILLLFLVLNKINKNKLVLNFSLSLLVGAGTSFVIYSRYLFLHNSFQLLAFMLLLYSFLLFDEKKSKVRFIIFTLSSVFFIIFWQALPAIVVGGFIIFWFSILFYKKIEKRFLFTYMVIILLIIFFELYAFLDYLDFLSRVGKKLTKESNLFFNLYNESLSAIDLKPASILYSIRYNSGNSIFLKFYPIFGYFFGPKGIFINSPFLVFSFLGMIKFDKRKRKALLLFLLFFILIFFLGTFEGDFSPRYVRHSEPTIVILTVFLANYLSKLKDKKTLLIFIFLATLSVSNSISIAIRTDWSYERVTDLVSYDIVLWPWLPSKSEDIILDVTKSSEGSKWNLKWEEGCNPPITEPRLSIFGLELGPCQCTFNNNASRAIKIPKEFKYLKIEACSRFAGGDGAILEIFVDNESYSYFINSQRCDSIIINISRFADDNIHTITLSAKRNGVCDYEVIGVKKLVFLKHSEIIEKENLIKNKLIWEVSSPCGIYWLNDSIVTGKCYCTFYSYASTQLKFKRDKPFLNVEVCADEAGNDGVIAKIIINGNTYSFFVPSNSCVKRSIFLNFEDDLEIKLNLTSETYGYCNNERVFWKSIKFENKPDGILDEKKEIYDLRSKEEQKNWKLMFSEACNPPLTEPRFSESGIETGPCACSFINNASRVIKIPKGFNALKIDVCSRFAGGDGISAYIYVDGEVIKKVNIDSNSCDSIILDISKFADDKNYTITLESRRHGSCREEVAIWRKLELLKLNYSFPVYRFDLIDDIEKWRYANMICKPIFTPTEIVTDFCNCLYDAKAVYSFITEKDKWINLRILGCADLAGGDGVIGKVGIDDNVMEMFIKSNSCNYFEKKIKLEKGNHTLYLKPEIYGNCSEEWVRWKEVVIEE
jgi:hypothetical protein